jgi:hypothetical protein
MGVDFFPCDKCMESICDCGDYVRCQCGHRWCGLDCAMEDGYVMDGNSEDDWDGEGEKPDWREWDESCKYCRKEDVEDSILLKFLLKHCKMTRKKALKLYFNKGK